MSGQWRPYDPSDVWERMPWVTDDTDFVEVARGNADTLAWEAEDWDFTPTRFTWGEAAYGDVADDTDFLFGVMDTVRELADAGWPTRYIGGQGGADAEAAAVAEVRLQRTVGRRHTPPTMAELKRALDAIDDRYPHTQACMCPPCTAERRERFMATGEHTPTFGRGSRRSRPRLETIWSE